MIFYFIATQPYLEKAVNGKIYLVQEDTEKDCQDFNRAYGASEWQVYQAEATNIMPANCLDNFSKA